MSVVGAELTCLQLLFAVGFLQFTGPTGTWTCHVILTVISTQEPDPQSPEEWAAQEPCWGDGCVTLQTKRLDSRRSGPGSGGTKVGAFLFIVLFNQIGGSPVKHKHAFWGSNGKWIILLKV